MSVTIPRKRKLQPSRKADKRASKGTVAKLPLLAPPLQGPMGEPPFVEVVTNAGSREFAEAWQKLCDESGDNNPFLFPQFITPALAHLCKEHPLTLIATWQIVGNEKYLTGIFPLVSPKRQSVRGWLFGGSSAFWKHPLLPFTEPLLTHDPDVAEASVAAFIDWLFARRPRLGTFVLPALRENGQVRSLMEAELLRHGITLESMRDRSHTRGLDFKPTAAPDVTNDVRVVRSIPEIKRDLEKALCLDALSHSAQTPVVSDLERSSFLRAVVRGFAVRSQLSIASIDQADARASAIVIETRELAYLWWIMGPQRGNPMIEASLSAAVEKALGKKIIAATLEPMAGIWAEPVKTITVTAQLSRAEKVA